MQLKRKINKQYTWGSANEQDQISSMKQGELESSIKQWMLNFAAQNPLVEVDLGIEGEPRIIKVSGLLAKEDEVWLIKLIKQYMDYFAWDNYNVP